MVTISSVKSGRSRRRGSAFGSIRMARSTRPSRSAATGVAVASAGAGTANGGGVAGAVQVDWGVLARKRGEQGREPVIPGVALRADANGAAAVGRHAPDL